MSCSEVSWAAAAVGRGAGRGRETGSSMAVAAGGWRSAVPPLSLLRPLHSVGSGGGSAGRAASWLHASVLSSGTRRLLQLRCKCPIGHR